MHTQTHTHTHTHTHKMECLSICYEFAETFESRLETFPLNKIYHLFARTLHNINSYALLYRQPVYKQLAFGR